jgi:rare lipoprotein A (peptidoglycan hydrolase)
VPVLDRGPYSNHADWDLTAGAAQKLEISETVRIAAHVVGSAPNTPLLGSPPVTPAEAATGGAQAAAGEPAATAAS